MAVVSIAGTVGPVTCETDYQIHALLLTGGRDLTVYTGKQITVCTLICSAQDNQLRFPTPDLWGQFFGRRPRLGPEYLYAF